MTEASAKLRSSTTHADGDESHTSAFTRPLNAFEVPFWAVDKLGDPVANIIPIRLEHYGPLDTERVEHVLNQLAAVHPALRLHVPSPGQSFAAVLGSVSVRVKECLLSPVSGKAWEATIDEEIKQRCLTPIDLTTAPLFRAEVLRLRDLSILLFTFHHLIIDGWSVARFVEMFIAAYEAGNVPSLTDQAHSASTAPSGVTARLAGSSFWRTILADAPPPARFVDGGGKADGNCPISAEVDTETATLIRGAARAAGVTLYTWLLAALAVQLGRHSGAQRISIGAPVALRGDEEHREALGCRVASVPVLVDIDESLSFKAFARLIRPTIVNAIAHADTPYHEIRQAANGDVFDVMLNLLSFPKPMALPPCWTLRAIVPAVSRFNSTFYVDWHDNGATILLARNGSQISDAFAAALIDQLLALLRQASIAPEKPIALLDADPEAAGRRHRLLTTHLTLEPASLVADILGQADDGIAVEAEGRLWTYRELKDTSASIARTLALKAGANGDRMRAVVCLSGQRCFGLVATVVAALRAGVPFLLVDPLQPAARLAHCRRHFDHVLDVSIGGSADDNDLVIGTDGSLGDFAPAYATSLDRAWGEAPAYVVFTSGTTGTPKLLKGHHAGLTHFVRWQRDRYAIGSSDRIPFITGFTFDVVLRDLLTPLVSGATLCIPPIRAFQRGGMLRWLEAARITAIHAVPTLTRTWLCDGGASRLPTLRRTFFAGEQLSGDLVRDWRRLAPTSAVTNLYGPSETTLAICYFDLPDEVPHGRIPVGVPIPGTQLWIECAGRAAAVGEIGDVMLRTPYRTHGDLAESEALAGFVENPVADKPRDWLYRTGDLGRLLPGGILELVGRSDGQVKINGVRVEPSEVTAVIRSLPEVSDAAVIFDASAQRLKAFVVAHGPLDPIWAALRHRLPAAMLPERITRIDAIPATGNGKIDWRALAVISGDPPPQQPGPLSLGSDPLTLAILEAWRQYLPTEGLGADDDFLQLGGSSLDLISLHAELCEQLSRELSLTAMFERPSVRGIWDLVAAPPTERVERQVPAVRARRDGAFRRIQARATRCEGRKV